GGRCGRRRAARHTCAGCTGPRRAGRPTARARPRLAPVPLRRDRREGRPKPPTCACSPQYGLSVMISRLGLLRAGRGGAAGRGGGLSALTVRLGGGGAAAATGWGGRGMSALARALGSGFGGGAAGALGRPRLAGGAARPAGG